MSLLIAGLLLFFTVHLIPAVRPLRRRLVETLGEKRYLGIYTPLSFAGLGLIVFGMRGVEFVALYEPPAWGRLAALALMAPSLFLLVAFGRPSNVKRFTAHPMLWGVFFWAAAHLAANGDLASTLLFASFALFSLFGMVAQNLRGARPGADRPGLLPDAVNLAIAALLYGGLVWGHAYVSGVPLLG